MRALLILISILSVRSFATGIAAETKLTCTASTALLRIWETEGRVHFRLDDSQGFNAFPFYSGAVTLPMLPLIQRGATELKVFDGRVEASWPASACEADPANPLLFRCGKGGQIDFPQATEFKMTSLGTWTEEVQGFGLQASVLNVYFGLDTKPENYTHYFVNFPFDRARCSFTAN